VQRRALHGGEHLVAGVVELDVVAGVGQVGLGQQAAAVVDVEPSELLGAVHPVHVPQRAAVVGLHHQGIGVRRYLVEQGRPRREPGLRKRDAGGAGADGCDGLVPGQADRPVVVDRGDVGGRRGLQQALAGAGGDRFQDEGVVPRDIGGQELPQVGHGAVRAEHVDVVSAGAQDVHDRAGHHLVLVLLLDDEAQPRRG